MPNKLNQNCETHLNLLRIVLNRSVPLFITTSLKNLNPAKSIEKCKKIRRKGRKASETISAVVFMLIKMNKIGQTSANPPCHVPGEASEPVARRWKWLRQNFHLVIFTCCGGRYERWWCKWQELAPLVPKHPPKGLRKYAAIIVSYHTYPHTHTHTRGVWGYQVTGIAWRSTPRDAEAVYFSAFIFKTSTQQQGGMVAHWIDETLRLLHQRDNGWWKKSALQQSACI